MRKKFYVTAVEPGDPRLDIVERVFSVEEKNRLRAGDIAYIPTKEGWLYLACTIGLLAEGGRLVDVGPNHGEACDRLGRASRRPRECPPSDGSLVFHDDQGVQYTSKAFRSCLDSHGIVQSASRPGTPLDNAVAKSFFKTLKRELVKGKDYKTREEAAQDIFKYIELRCNTVRMHSALDYDSPADYERICA